MRKSCLDALYSLAKEDDRIFFIGSDLSHGTLDQFKAEMPDRFFMEGVSEANIIGMAAGLALEGNIPYVNTIASFLTRRAYENIVLDVCLHKANVRLIGNGGGLGYAQLGPTHQTLEDLAILRAIPNMTVIAPASSQEVSLLMPLTVEYPGPLYIRLGADPGDVPKIPANGYSIGRAVHLQKGTEALLVTTGTTLGLGAKVADLLLGQGINAGLLHVPTIKPLDKETILNAFSKAAVIVTLEEHSVIGGLGSAAAELIAEASFNPTKIFRRIGLPDAFYSGYGSWKEALQKNSIDEQHVTQVVKTLLIEGR